MTTRTEKILALLEGHPNAAMIRYLLETENPAIAYTWTLEDWNDTCETSISAETWAEIARGCSGTMVQALWTSILDSHEALEGAEDQA